MVLRHDGEHIGVAYEWVWRTACDRRRPPNAAFGRRRDGLQGTRRRWATRATTVKWTSGPDEQDLRSIAWQVAIKPGEHRLLDRMTAPMLGRDILTGSVGRRWSMGRSCIVEQRQNFELVRFRGGEEPQRFRVISVVESAFVWPLRVG